jgi:hypothetical protein
MCSPVPADRNFFDVVMPAQAGIHLFCCEARIRMV